MLCLIELSQRPGDSGAKVRVWLGWGSLHLIYSRGMVRDILVALRPS